MELPDDDVVEGAVEPGGRGDHLGELVAGAGLVSERGRYGESSGLAVVWAGFVLVVCGEDVPGGWEGVSDVDGGLWHGVKEGIKPAGAAWSPFPACQSLSVSYS